MRRPPPAARSRRSAGDPERGRAEAGRRCARCAHVRRRCPTETADAACALAATGRVRPSSPLAIACGPGRSHAMQSRRAKPRYRQWSRDRARSRSHLAAGNQARAPSAPSCARLRVCRAAPRDARRRAGPRNARARSRGRTHDGGRVRGGPAPPNAPDPGCQRWRRSGASAACRSCDGCRGARMPSIVRSASAATPLRSPRPPPDATPPAARTPPPRPTRNARPENAAAPGSGPAFDESRRRATTF